MRDRLSTKILSNGAARYGVYDEEGNLLRYEYIRLEDDPSVEGDLFSKANVLPDGIPRLLGLKMENPQVKDALNVLANVGNMHVWSKVSRVVTYEVEDGTTASNYQIPARETVYYSDEVDATGGVLSLVNPSSEYFNGNSYLPGLFKNKYFYTSSDSVIRKGAETTNDYVDPSDYWQISTYSVSVKTIQADTLVDFPTSTDPTAYPHDGDVGDYHYTYFGRLGGPWARIKVFTYAGTGTYGSSNPVVLSFDFRVKYMMFFGRVTGGEMQNFSIGYNEALAVDALERWHEEYTSRFGFSNSNTARIERSYMYGKKSADGKTISFYSTYAASDQMNMSGTTYYGVAIG